MSTYTTPGPSTRAIESRKRDRDLTVAEILEQEEMPRKRHRLESLSHSRPSLSRSYSELPPAFAHHSDFSVDSLRTSIDADNKLIMPPTRPPASSVSTGSNTRSCVYEDADPIIQRGKRLMRSCSMQSLSETNKPKYHPTSAFFNLKYTQRALDYAPTACAAGSEVGGLPFTASVDNVVFFPRGNRVHYKNPATNEDIGQLCKLKDKHGDLKLLTCAGFEYPNLIAAGTGNHISLFDITTKKEILGWTSKNHTFLAWNGPTLTVGTRNGVIRSYDTRMRPVSSMKERLTKSTRHESMITALSWNESGKLLASGEENGAVLVWDIRSRPPLDIGEHVQRRRKIQHDGRLTTIGWCEYSSKIFATGDSRGILRVWNADVSDPSHVVAPGRVEVGATIRSLFFSPHAKEILVVKGPKAEGASDPVNGAESPDFNCLTSYSYPSLRHITSAKVSQNNKVVGNAIFLPGGTKTLVSVPDEGKLHLWDAYCKPKNLKRQSSLIIR